MLVSHPHIRWDALRATEGWAALQHHNILRGTLKITPPQGASSDSVPWLRCSFKQISFFALLPQGEDGHVVEWHPGDIYALKNSPKQLIQLSNVLLSRPTTFNVFVSGDYEIRLFGDPTAFGRKTPVLDLGIDISLESPGTTIIQDADLHVVCDFVEGWAFGTVLGLGIRSHRGEWKVNSVSTDSRSFNLALLHENQRIISSQTRIVPVLLNQIQPYFEKHISIKLELNNSEDQSHSSVEIDLPLRHQEFWFNSTDASGILASYLLNENPTAYVAIPPKASNASHPSPAVLALHGAGVDVSDSFWASSLPRQTYSWIVCPSGLTSWGLDWHGASSEDVWGSLSALQSVLYSRKQWSYWKPKDGPVMVIGHSNGGQGTWYITSRYPDRVFAAIPAAAYIKSQQYIPLSLSHGAHFVDPALNAVFAAALAPDDNDLFLSNVVHTSILAVHGGADENVPTWHSRELVSVVKGWNSDANISFLEDRNKPHWYPTVFQSKPVREFLSEQLEAAQSSESTSFKFSKPFTLTVATPSGSGSLHGFSIRENAAPGRLARLNVIPNGNRLLIRTTNVHTFSFIPHNIRDISIDNTRIVLTHVDREIWVRQGSNGWKVLSHPPFIYQTGPMTRILRSTKPILIVYSAQDSHSLSIARRIAHSLLLFFRIDSEIMTDAEAIRISLVDYAKKQTLIIIGSMNQFGSKLLDLAPSLVILRPAEIVVNGIVYNEPSIGIAFLQPFPLGRLENTNALFLSGTDSEGLERAARLFLPVRSGVPLPEFILLSKDSDTMSLGGVIGAGFWSREGRWSDATAWLTQPYRI